MDQDKAPPSPGWHRRRLDAPLLDPDCDINSERIDTILLKRLLSTALSHNAIDYWRCLRNYMTGKLKHGEFQRRALEYLGSNLHLHNEFMLGIMHNSQSYVPVPQGPSSKGFTPIKKPVNYDLDVALKRSAKDSSAGEAHRTKRRRDILSLAKEDRERLEALPRGIRQEPLPQMRRNQAAFDLIDRLDPSPTLCTELKDLPNKEMMRSRMRLVLSVNGLNDEIPEECLDLLSCAVESHINNTIGGCLSKTSLPESANVTTTSRVETPVGGNGRAGGANTPMLINVMSPRSPTTTTTFIPSIVKQSLDIELVDFSLKVTPLNRLKEVREQAAARIIQEPDYINIGGIEVRK